MKILIVLYSLKYLVYFKFKKDKLLLNIDFFQKNKTIYVLKKTKD